MVDRSSVRLEAFKDDKNRDNWELIQEFIDDLTSENNPFLNFQGTLYERDFEVGPDSLLTADGDASGLGLADVPNIDLFEMNQRVTLVDDDTSAADFYVIAIDYANDRVAVSANPGSVNTSIAAYTTAKNARIYGGISLTFAHDLAYVPQDVIITRNTNNVSVSIDSVSADKITITVGGATTLRYLVGRFVQ